MRAGSSRRRASHPPGRPVTFQGHGRFGAVFGGRMDGLVDGFVAREPHALEHVYALWARLFVSVARHVTGDNAMAEDCVHDALVRVWRSPNRFSGNREMLKG